MTEFRYFIVKETETSQRLDRLISNHYSDFSRTRIQDLIRQGYIKADGKEVSASDKVKEGVRIDLVLPQAEEAIPQPQHIPLDILYEDQDLIVLNKAAGMVVHPAPGSVDQTLVNALLSHCGDSLSGIGGIKRPGIVHRLDKGTSGLLVVAKNDVAHRGLSGQFSSRSLSRTYQALIWGVPNSFTGTITGNIGRSPRHRQKMALLSSGGKEAMTHYKILKTFGSIVSLVECRLETGRTHQIRVHLTSIGHPLIGDPLYGSAPHKAPLALRKALMGLTQNLRPLLHAWRIEFVHPRTQEKLSFSVILPDDFLKAIDIMHKYVERF
jgi:23S rRNA pseudouridine1911/1915/1917 synthase